MAMKALFILDPGSYEQIYGPAERADIAALVDVYAPAQTKESVASNPHILKPCQIIFSGWGAPCLDAAFLAAAR